jgi:hypothetical protein
MAKKSKTMAVPEPEPEPEPSPPTPPDVRHMRAYHTSGEKVATSVLLEDIDDFKKVHTVGVPQVSHLTRQLQEQEEYELSEIESLNDLIQEIKTESGSLDTGSTEYSDNMKFIEGLKIAIADKEKRRGESRVGKSSQKPKPFKMNSVVNEENKANKAKDGIATPIPIPRARLKSKKSRRRKKKHKKTRKSKKTRKTKNNRKRKSKKTRKSKKRI